MGRLDDASWWWEYALDGVVGGIIGGLVTGVAVWLTLRHERVLVRRSAAQDAAGRVMAAAWTVTTTAHDDDATDLDEMHAAAPLVAASRELGALTKRKWPTFSADLLRVAEELVATLDLDRGEERADAAFSAGAKVNKRVEDWLEEL